MYAYTVIHNILQYYTIIYRIPHVDAGYVCCCALAALKAVLEAHPSEASVHQASWQVLELIALRDEETLLKTRIAVF